jgi:hypothetical protein
LKLRAFFFAFILLATSAVADDDCIAVYGSIAVKNFLHQLQVAVATDNRAQVVSMVRLPINIEIAGKQTRLRYQSELLKYYDVAFDPKVKGFIAKQKFEDLFCNWQGVMIGRGEIWINSVGKPSRLKIITINNDPPWSPDDK